MWQVTCSQRPPTLSQRHVDLHVWSYPRRSYIFYVSSKSVKGFWSPWGSKFAHSHYFGYWLLQQLALPCKPWQQLALPCKPWCAKILHVLYHVVLYYLLKVIQCQERFNAKLANLCSKVIHKMIMNDVDIAVFLFSWISRKNKKW